VPMRCKMHLITFTNTNFKDIDPTQEYPMVITVEIKNFAVMKTTIDQGNLVDILYWSTFKKLQIPKSEIEPHDDQIVGSSGERVYTKGYVDMYTKFGKGKSQTRTIRICYLLVDTNTSYNVLFGRLSLNLLGTIMSTPHLTMKFSSPSGCIIIVHVDQKTARECYVASLKVEPTPRIPSDNEERRVKKRHVVAVANLDPRIEEVRVEPQDETRPIPLLGKDKITRLGTSLSKEDAKKISWTLREKVDAFA